MPNGTRHELEDEDGTGIEKTELSLRRPVSTTATRVVEEVSERWGARGEMAMFGGVFTLAGGNAAILTEPAMHSFRLFFMQVNNSTEGDGAGIDITLEEFQNMACAFGAGNVATILLWTGCMILLAYTAHAFYDWSKAKEKTTEGKTQEVNNHKRIIARRFVGAVVLGLLPFIFQALGVPMLDCIKGIQLI